MDTDVGYVVKYIEVYAHVTKTACIKNVVRIGAGVTLEGRMEKNEKKQDRRVVKTKRAIRQAFAEQLKKKSIDEITIKDIADSADINRKTFYNYYNGIYQIVDEIEGEFAEAVELALSEIDLKKEMRNPYLIFARITSIINADVDFYGHLLKMRSGADLISKIEMVLREKLKLAFSNQFEVESSKLDVMVVYTVAGMLSVYKEWLNSNRLKPIEEVSETVSILCINGISEIVGDE